MKAYNFQDELVRGLSQKEDEEKKEQPKVQTIRPKKPYPEPADYVRFEAIETYQKPEETKVTGQKKSKSDREAVKE